MFSLKATEIPSLLLENRGLNGFYFFTLPSIQQRTYRITMEDTNRGEKWSRYFDFTLDTGILANDPNLWDDLNHDDTYPDGVIFIGIPFDANLFKHHTVDNHPPASIVMSEYNTFEEATTQSEGPDTFSGQTFKLILLEPYNVSVNLIEINRDYHTGDSMIIRFIYYRTVSGEIVFTSSFGDIVSNNQELDSFKPLIDQNHSVSVVNVTPMKRYYIFRVTNTPNIIFSVTRFEKSEDQYFEEYTNDGVNYRLTLPGHIYTDVPFILYLNTLNENGEIVEPPSNLRISSNISQNYKLEVLRSVLISDTKTWELTLKTNCLDPTMEIYVYGKSQ